MKSIFRKIFTLFISFWRTIVSTFVRKEDVDQDGKEEIIIDLNGVPSSMKTADQNKTEGENDYDNK